MRFLKLITLFFLSGLFFLSLCVQAGITSSDKKKITSAMEDYLAVNGDFCLGKFDWPIDVSQRDISMSTRDAIQMPVLEKFGLVEFTTGLALRKEDSEHDNFVSVRHYALTEKGKKFYLAKTVTSTGPDGKVITHDGDLCAANLRLDKVVDWGNPVATDNQPEITVTYTYHVKATDWSMQPEIQKVFPMVARIVNGAETLELKQRLRQVDKKWIAVSAKN